MPNIHLSGSNGAMLQILRHPILRCVGKCSDLPAYSINRHAHPHTMEMIYIVEGEGMVDVSGETRRIGPHDLVLYNPGVFHRESFDFGDKAPLFYHVKFDEFAVMGLPEGCLLPPGQPPILSCGEYSDFMEATLRIMFQEWSRQDVGFEQITQSLLLCIVLFVLRMLDAQGDEIEKSKMDALHAQIRRYIDTHYAEPITMRDVADAFHINYHYLPHLFQQKLGVSPFRYLTELRVNKACQLLSSTKLSVGKIAAQVGYANQSTFQVQFKKIKAMSPLQYRLYYQSNQLVVHEAEHAGGRIIRTEKGCP